MGTVRKTITLTDRQDGWIKTQIAAGRFTNDSEYIRNLIRRDQEESAGLEALRAAVKEGLDSGPSDKTIPTIMAEVEARRFKARPHAFNFKPGVDTDRLNQLADELDVEEFARKQGLDQPLPDWQRDLIRDRLTALEDLPPAERSVAWEAIRKRLSAGKK